MLREMIARLPIRLKIKRIKSGNKADSLILSIPDKHFTRKPQEVNRRATIIFQNNCRLLLFKNPVNR